MPLRHFRAMLGFSLIFIAASALGATHKTLYSFTGGADGSFPNGPMVFDSSGNLYGVTNSGGNNECDSSLSAGCGTIFQLTPDGKGGWSEKVLYVFNEATDGGNSGLGVIKDASGNLYGTTQYYGPFANGVLWRLKASGGKWSEQIVHAFRGTWDGFWCFGLTFDPHGRLFGTTYAGGKSDNGLVFELHPESGGKWLDSILYQFKGGSDDGDSPSDPVIFDSHGNIYGTTYEGGPHLTGTVFEMQHTSKGWKEGPIYIFQGLPFGKSSDGTNPVAGVVIDKAGNLYGTADYGGAHGVGAVYELSPDGKGGWTERLLHIFADGKDGGHPTALIRDSAGNLYGTTTGHNTAGSVYKLSPGKNGKWTFTVLYDFTGGADGGAPSGALVRDASGNLYGTTAFGGKGDNGVVFEIQP